MFPFVGLSLTPSISTSRGGREVFFAPTTAARAGSVRTQICGDRSTTRRSGVTLATRNAFTFSARPSPSRTTVAEPSRTRCRATRCTSITTRCGSIRRTPTIFCSATMAAFICRATAAPAGASPTTCRSRSSTRSVSTCRSRSIASTAAPRTTTVSAHLAVPEAGRYHQRRLVSHGGWRRVLHPAGP